MIEKNQRGITLIALVITIIVLLILAGVTINVLLGQDGIINRTQQAKEQHEYAAAKEIIDLKLVEIYTDAVSKNEEYTMSKIATGMEEDTNITIDEKYFNTTASLDSVNTLKGIVVSANQYSRFKFLVSGKNGSIQLLAYTTESIPDSWTTGDLPTGFIAIGESKQGTPTSTSYTVTFKDGETTLSTATVEEGETATKPATNPTKDGFDFVNWYSDSELTNLFDFTSTITGDTTIYAKWTEVATGPTIKLIDGTTRAVDPSKDYGRKVRYVDASGNKMAGKDWRLFYVEDSVNLFGDGEGTIYLKADWWDNDYEGSRIYDTNKTLIRKLNPDWATARGTSESSWNNNENAAAHLCDTSVWEPIYKSTNTAYSGKINWVVGAPPVEMFMKSYSQRVSGASDYRAKYEAYEANGTTAYGYKYTTNGSSWSTNTGNNTIRSEQANGMYLHHEGQVSDKYCYEWLASPTSVNADNMCYVNGKEAKADRIIFNEKRGLCPLVSLKSNFLLEEIP